MPACLWWLLHRHHPCSSWLHVDSVANNPLSRAIPFQNTSLAYLLPVDWSLSEGNDLRLRVLHTST
eukprot:m.190532 g.190532  ORF g.190532 m.190532 type:complete len:66 (+) comp14820_c0_seq2:3955-4152(+)